MAHPVRFELLTVITPRNGSYRRVKGWDRIGGAVCEAGA